MKKIGHGHETVIVARAPEGVPLYFTKGRCWVSDPGQARLFQRASDAHRESAGCFAGDGRRVYVEGIFTDAFGHGD